MDIKNLLYCLSLNEYSDNLVRFQHLEQSVSYFMGEDKKHLDYYIDCYKQQNVFPSYSTFLSIFKLEDNCKSFEQINIDRQGFLNSIWGEYTQKVKELEIMDLQTKIITENDLKEKNKLLSRLQVKLSRNIKSVDLVEIADSRISDEVKKDIQAGVIFPVKDLNEAGCLLPGTGASLISIPGGGKTTFAINMVYLNSYKQDKNSLYIFAEDVYDNYNYRVKSRASLDLGMNIQVKSLQYSIRDEETIIKLKELDDKFTENRKGRIYFTPFSSLDPDPMTFANIVSDLIVRYDIDFVVMDYIQRVELWKPKGFTKNEYLNLMVSSFFQILLGSFNSKPVAGLLLAQTTKDGITRANKTKGRYNLEDAKEVGNIETDSFFLLTTWMDEEQKEAGIFSHQLLKCRYGSSYVVPRTSSTELLYCSMGDVETDLEKIYNNESIQDVFNDSMEDL
jgi:hypothetical protein